MAEVIKINSKYARITLSQDELAQHNLNKYIRHNYGSSLTVLEGTPFDIVAARLIKFEMPEYNAKMVESISYRPESGAVDMIVPIALDRMAGRTNTNTNKRVFKTEYVNPLSVANKKNHETMNQIGDSNVKDYVMLNSKKASVQAPSDFQGTEVEIAKLATLIGQYGNIADYKISKNEKTGSAEVIFSLAEDAEEFLIKSASDKNASAGDEKNFLRNVSEHDTKVDPELLQSLKEKHPEYNKMLERAKKETVPYSLDSTKPAIEPVSEEKEYTDKDKAIVAEVLQNVLLDEISSGKIDVKTASTVFEVLMKDLYKVANDGSQKPIIIYHSGNLTMDGKGIDKITVDGFDYAENTRDYDISGSITDGLEKIFEALTTDIPEYTDMDMSLYFNYDGLDVDYNPSTPGIDEAVQKVWDWIGNNVSIVNTKQASVKKANEFKSDEDIASEFNNFKILSIEVSKSRSGEGYTGSIEIEFPEAGESVGGGTNYVYDNFFVYDNALGRFAFDNWYPDEVISVLKQRIREEIVNKFGEKQASVKTSADIMSVDDTKQNATPEVRDEASRRLEMINKLPAEYRSKIIKEFQKAKKADPSKYDTFDKESRALELIAQKYVGGGGEVTLSNESGEIATIKYKPVEDGTKYLVLDIQGDPIATSKLEEVLSTSNYETSSFEDLIDAAYGSDALSIMIDDSGSSSVIDPIEQEFETAEIDEEGRITASIRELIYEKVAEIKKAEGMIGAPIVNTVGPDVSQNLPNAIVENSTGAQYTLKSTENISGSPVGTYEAPDGSKTLQLNDEQITNDTKYSPVTK